MAANSESEDDKQESGAYALARDRSRRDKKGSKANARAELLAKIKKAKETGQKFVQEEKDDDVYDVVDEQAYSDLVRKRQEDDWIVEDGTGYKDDGLEIFDEGHAEDEDETGKSSTKSKGSKKKNPNIRKPDSAPSNLSAMFAAAAARSKPKQKEDKKHHDEILEELLASAEGETAAAPAVKPILKRKQPIELFTKRAVSQTIKREPISQADLADDSLQTPSAGAESITFEDEAMTEDHIEDSSNKNVKNVVVKKDISDMFDDDMNDEHFMEPEVKQESVPSLKQDLTQSWMKEESFMSSSADSVLSSAETSVSSAVSADLPTVFNSNAEPVFRFYWLDAFEDYFKHPGTIYLFGKTRSPSGSYLSCCVCIRNIYRQVFVLPRQHKYDMKSKSMTNEPVAFLDVYNEFNNDVASKYRIKSFKSKATKKLYAFEYNDVPKEADYLEIRYGSEYPALSKDLYGETFSHVFGTNTSSLEMFLLEQKIKGPCWLDIVNPQSSSHSISWCKHEVVVSDFKTVAVTEDSSLTAPPLTTLTLSVKAALNSKNNQNEVVQVACLINNEYYVDKPPPDKLFHEHFLVVSKTSDIVYPLDLTEKLSAEGKHLRMEVLASERALLGFLLAKIHKHDPDILIGHDLVNYELDFLMQRIASNKVPHWHKISRLKRSGDIPRKGMGKSLHIDRSATCGRLICDVMISAKELIRAKSYDLSELVHQVLAQKREEVEMEQLKAAYNTSTDLMRASNLTIQDAFYAHKLMFEMCVLPLAWQITAICGNVLSRTLNGGRSERNEYLLLHAFAEKGYIPPDKNYQGNKNKNKGRPPADDEEGEEVDTGGTSKRKPAYAGGLVLEPKKGFYDTFILLLDFNSLYPSIIQEYNICFTTVSHVARESQDGDPDDLKELPDIPDANLPQGVLPVEIRKLVQSRKTVRELMKDKTITKEQYMQYDIRQKALKLTANSMYGCLGFTFSRFYAKPLAALITAKGREILMKTKDLVEKQGLEVIYGDTDSIMINTNSRSIDEVFKLGNKVKSEVNKAYKLLEIDIDGVFKSMLLLKKKKYAALNISKGPDGQIITTQQMKGLDIVRRDWCELSKQTGEYVVGEILSGESKDSIVQNIHSKLQEVKAAVNEGTIPLELYCITKQLTKAPEAYPDKKSLPHVQVAIRINSNPSAKQLRAGDVVSYVICKDGSNLPASQRAYAPDELSKNELLKIDVEYYLAHQVHPVVSRLCDPIDGTDSSLIAEMLGLDSSRYRHKTAAEEEEEDDTQTRLMSEEEKYKHCDRLEFVCQAKGCGRKNVIDAPFKPSVGNSYVYSLEFCAALNDDGRPNHILHITSTPSSENVQESTNVVKNKLSQEIRSHINKYYQGWLKCEDSACGHRTRRVPLQLFRGRPVCPSCTKSSLVQEYTESMLYDQLCFYKYVFSSQNKPKSMSSPTTIEELYTTIYQYMEARLSRSEYGTIDLHKLFSKIILPSSILSSTQG